MNQYAIDLKILAGTNPDHLTSEFFAEDVAGSTVVEALLDSLDADTKYYFQVLYRPAVTTGAYRTYKPDTLRTEGTGIFSFHTARDPGERFVFTIEADAHHLGRGVWPDGGNLYATMQDNLARFGGDFHFTLGDHFLIGAADTTYSLVLEEQLEVRQGMDSLGVTCPFFFVIGNHECEKGWSLSDADSITLWTSSTRELLWPNPAPNDFYSGLREAYYSFEWGDALFVVLDPYWYTMTNPATSDQWDWTLGKTQYDWLYTTLAASSASWKLVFIHQLVGGVIPYGRGGIEAVKHSVAGKPTFEWGGEDTSGVYAFDTKRPGWTHGPIHDLLDSAGVDIVFKGHDHGYVYQELDGIVYQTAPFHGCFTQCYAQVFATGEYADSNSVKEYNPGLLKVTVDPDSLVVEYVRTVWAGVEPLVEDGDSVYNRTISQRISLTAP